MEAEAAERFLGEHLASANFVELSDHHMAGMIHRAARALHGLERDQIDLARATILETLRTIRFGAAMIAAV